MAYPLRRYEDGVEESQPARPFGPVVVEDDAIPATAPAGARVLPRRLPPGVAGTDFGQFPFPSRRPILPPGLPCFAANYISFLTAVVAVVFLVLILVAAGGFWAIGSLSFPL